MSKYTHDELKELGYYHGLWALENCCPEDTTLEEFDIYLEGWEEGYAIYIEDRRRPCSI